MCQAAKKRTVVPKNKHSHPSLIQFNTLCSQQKVDMVPLQYAEPVSDLATEQTQL